MRRTHELESASPPYERVPNISQHTINNLFVEPACDERDVIVTISIRCICVRWACVRPSEFVRAITSTFMHGFQKYLGQLFSLRSESTI